MIPLETIRKLEAERLITVRTQGDLIICNYTPKCVYDVCWTPHTMQCRGLILRVDKPWPESTAITEIVALPFPKFWNVGEGDRYPTSGLMEVTEKMDGSMGVGFRMHGEHRIATRGSFDSEMAQWASEYLKRFDLKDLPVNYTLLFEIIYPENRIVIDYGNREDLVLLGVRDRFNGNDFYYSKIRQIANEFGFSLPAYHIDLSFLGVEKILVRAKELGPDQEGWVLRFNDGTRFKVKGDTYRELHRIISNISPKAILEALASGVIDTLLPTIPEEYRPEVDRWHREYLDRYVSILTEVAATYERAPKGNRKEFALWTIQNYKPRSHMLFALLDGRDIAQMVYKEMLGV